MEVAVARLVVVSRGNGIAFPKRGQVRYSPPTWNFTEAEMIKRITAAGPYDLVLSDAAPATSGNKVIDTGRSEALVESVLAGLPAWLVPGGGMVTKLFQGGGEQQLRQAAQAVFTSATLFRPQAVRSESFETYLVGIGYRGEE
jgi:23S rRNA (uridine2552-2'-O)-methyltransferase